MKIFYIVWTIIGIILLTCFAGCLYGCAQIGKEIDKSLTEDENIKAAVEMATVDRSDVYNWVKTSMTKKQVKDKFGEPTKIQQMESDVSGMMEGLEDLGVDVGNTKMELEYWYYGNVQIGFMNGKVNSKMKI